MTERDPFELRLAGLFGAYADRAPVDIDAGALSVAIAQPAQPTIEILGRSLVRPRWLVPALLALLLLAALAAAVFIGSRLLLNDIAPYQMVITAAPDMNRTLTNAIVSPLSDTEILISGRGRSYRYDLTTGGQTLVGGEAPDGDANDQVVLPDGSVFVMTFQGNFADEYAYVFDPNAGAFRKLSYGPSGETGNDPIYGVKPSIALLDDGRVLIVGGHPYAETGQPQVRADALIFDPTDESFVPTGSMSTPREQQSMTAMKDGRVLVAGGYSSRTDGHLGRPSVVTNLNTAEIYDPRTGEFGPPMTMSDIGGPNLSVALPDGRIAMFPTYLDGATTLSEPEATGPFAVVVFDPRDQTFTVVGFITHLPSSATGLRDGRVLLTGSYNKPAVIHGGGVYPNLDVPWAATFDPSTGQSATLDGRAAELVGVAALPDGDVVIAGGQAYPPLDAYGNGTGEPFEVPWVQIFK